MVTLVRAPFALAVIAVLAAAPALAKPPLDFQDPPPDPPVAGAIAPVGPGQFRGEGTVPERLTGVGAFQRLPGIDESPTVVVAMRADPVWKAATFDPVLTNACRLGDFASVPLNPMVVQFRVPGGGEGTGALQWIPPDRRHLLVDRRRLAAPGEAYYFEDASFPSCRVWVENLVRPRKLGANGTSLPPADPAALKKEKAMIKAWPQQ